MHCSFLLVCLLSPALFLVASAQTKRVADRMYVSFDRARYCVRRLNGTHEIGCQSSMNGNSGRMYMIDSEQEFDSYLANGQLVDSFASFIIVLHIDLFDSNRVDRLMARLDSKLNGLLIYQKSNLTRPADFSHDDQCPNNRPSFHLNQTVVNWNPKGTGLFFRSFPFPIMLIDEEDDYRRLLQFYQKFNASQASPACGLELKAFQNAAHTSKTCMRRNEISHSLIDIQETFCDPIGGLNIHSKLPLSLTVTPNKRQPKSVILVLARTDSFQMFLKTKGITGGAQQPAAALVTFLALAHLVGQEQGKFGGNDGKEIVFVTLDGDALDYSASYKFMFDMINGYFPNGDTSEERIKVEHIHSIIELQSLSMTENLWLHMSPLSLTNKTFVDALTLSNPMIRPIATGNSLPPASSQIFLRQTSSSSFPAYILSSANQDQLANHYYHSFFDDPSTLSIDVSQLEYNSNTDFSRWVKRVVEPLAQTLIEFTTGQKSNVTIKQEIVNNLVYCILKNVNCPLIHNVTNQSIGDAFQSFDLVPMPFSINTYPISATPTFPFVLNVLAYFLRDRSFDEYNATEASCKDLASNDTLRSYTFAGGYLPSIMSGQTFSGYCVRSYSRSIQSTSPAFAIDNYDLAQTTYPAWTESRWTTVSLRVFVIPTRTHEVVTLVIGLLLLCLSFTGLFILRHYTTISLLQPSSS